MGVSSWTRPNLLRLLLLESSLLITHAGAMQDLKAGDPIPSVTMTTITGESFVGSAQEGTIQIYLFGQSEHPNTLRACKLINDALSNPRFKSTDVRWIYVLSKSSDPSAIEPCWQDSKRQATIVHDLDRTAFGAFGIIIVPTIIIADDHSKVVYVMAGIAPRFGDIVTDALLLASRQIEPDEFERTVHPTAEHETDDRIRAHRHVELARHAARRGLDAMASEQYAKAIEIDPTYTSAKLGLGYTLYRQRKLDQARTVFEELVESDPSSTNAKLGFATVLIAMGDEHLANAKELIDQVLDGHPDDPRGHYTRGLWHAARGETDKASASFRLANELLLDADDPDQHLND